MVGYKVRRGLGMWARQLKDVAEKTWEIAPGVDEPHVPLYIPESHFGRIEAHAPPYQHQPVSSLLAAIRQERCPSAAGACRGLIYCAMHFCSANESTVAFTRAISIQRSAGALWRANTAEIAEGVMASTYSGARDGSPTCST